MCCYGLGVERFRPFLLIDKLLTITLMTTKTISLILSYILMALAWGERLPNIIYVMVDDAGIGDFSNYGGKEIQTPVMEMMSKKGMQFSNAYSGNAICGPTRCVLMTGMHPGHALRRANQSESGLLPTATDTMTVARLLKNAGYATGGFGKWGLGNVGTTGVPEKQGFDEWYGYYDQKHAHNYYPDYLVRNSERVELPGNKGGKKESYTHYLIEKETLGFIEKNKDKPFFCYAAWTPPHGSFQIPADDPAVKLYAGKPWSEKTKTCAAMVTMLDRGVGKIVEKVRELGIEENTLIVYTSDNGCVAQFVKPLKSNGGLRGSKSLLYEGGIRAPMVAYWPNVIEAGSKSDALTSGVDLLATAADLVGKPLEGKADGVSILPVLKGERGARGHEFLYFEIYEPRFQQCVRMGDWKGYRLGTKEPLELYDLSKDPKEQADVAGKNEGVVKEIEAIMAREHVSSPHYTAPERKGGKNKLRRNGKKKK